LVDFLDSLLANFRKFRDTYKLMLAAETRQMSNYELMSNHEDLKELVNDLLMHVLKVFYRVSQAQESDEDQFPLEYYRSVVHDNWLLDVAKLFDIAAIYGQTNPQVVK
jgi:hypothetical protein